MSEMINEKFFEPHYMLHYEVDGKFITGTVYMVERKENGTVLYLSKKTCKFDTVIQGEGENCIPQFEFNFSFGRWIESGPEGELFMTNEDGYMGNELKRLAKVWEEIELYLLKTYINNLL